MTAIVAIYLALPGVFLALGVYALFFHDRYCTY